MGQQPAEGVAISQAESQTEIAMVRALLREYILWAFTLVEDSESVPTFVGVEQELASLPGVYAKPAGRLLLATYQGRTAGCVCLKPHDPDVCEVKRLYVHPDMRGLNIGALLIEKLVDEARQAGYRKIILDTHVSMSRAHAIYEAAGFVRVPVPDDFPEDLKHLAIFMECELTEGNQSTRTTLKSR